jgi:hypothetical protein
VEGYGNHIYSKGHVRKRTVYALLKHLFIFGWILDVCKEGVLDREFFVIIISNTLSAS